MIGPVIVQPLVYGVVVAAVVSGGLVLSVVIGWWRLGGLRPLFPLTVQLRRAAAASWPLALSLGLVVWSWAFVIALVRLTGSLR